MEIGRSINDCENFKPTDRIDYIVFEPIFRPLDLLPVQLAELDAASYGLTSVQHANEIERSPDTTKSRRRDVLRRTGRHTTSSAIVDGFLTEDLTFIPDTESEPPGLTTIQLQQLGLVALGYERSGIARLRGVSLETVKTHGKVGRRKIQAINTQHSMRMSFRRRIFRVAGRDPSAEIAA